MDHVINGCILVFVSSAATEDMYISSRTIYGLSMAVILYDNRYEQISDKETDRSETMPLGIMSHGQMPYYSTKIREQN